jgi:hypothetical protein
MNRPISVARFTGWVISCRQPSTKVLGYFQASAARTRLKPVVSLPRFQTLMVGAYGVKLWPRSPRTEEPVILSSIVSLVAAALHSLWVYY